MLDGDSVPRDTAPAPKQDRWGRGAPSGTPAHRRSPVSLGEPEEQVLLPPRGDSLLRFKVTG